MAKKTARKKTETAKSRTKRKASAKGGASRTGSQKARTETASSRQASKKKAAKASAKRASAKKAAVTTSKKSKPKSTSKTAARSTTKKKTTRSKAASKLSAPSTKAKKKKVKASVSAKEGAARRTSTDRTSSSARSQRKVANNARRKSSTSKQVKASKTKSGESQGDAKGVLMHPGIRIATFKKSSRSEIGKEGSAANTNSSGANKRSAKVSRSSNKVVPATDYDPIQFEQERKKLPKTRLGEARLSEFKELLLRKRSELVGDVVRLTDEALHRRSEGNSDNSSMPIHMADLGSDNWEQDFTLGLLASEQTLVREIDAALQRILDRTFGICLATHRPIGVARLRAKPWARYCIEYARAREEGRAI